MTKNRFDNLDTEEMTEEAASDVGAGTGTTSPTEEGASAATDDAAVSGDVLQAKLTALEDSLLRAKADYQNLQRRTTIDRSEAIRFANAELMRSLVNVLDDFDRSLKAAESSKNFEAVVDGVRLVNANLHKALSEQGLETIHAMNEKFDPAIHEAVMQQPSDKHAPGTVVEEIAKGYRLRGRVIRPAKVIVAKAPEAS